MNFDGNIPCARNTLSDHDFVDQNLHHFPCQMLYFDVFFDQFTAVVTNGNFDFNLGNPLATNMDGVHLNGCCHHGVIRNLKGACYDDLVALNAYEGYAGPITDIVIDGLYAEDCRSAVRLLAIHEELKNIHINDALRNPELMLDAELADLSRRLSTASAALGIRANYGSAIMTSLFGAEMFIMRSRRL